MGAVAAVAALAERLGAPVLGEPMGALATLPTDHPLWRGPLPPFARDIGPALAPFDVVLVAGGPVFRLFGHSEGAMVPEGTRLVHLEADPGGDREDPRRRRWAGRRRRRRPGRAPRAARAARTRRGPRGGRRPSARPWTAREAGRARVAAGAGGGPGGVAVGVRDGGGRRARPGRPGGRRGAHLRPGAAGGGAAAADRHVAGPPRQRPRVGAARRGGRGAGRPRAARDGAPGRRRACCSASTRCGPRPTSGCRWRWWWPTTAATRSSGPGWRA